MAIKTFKILILIQFSFTSFGQNDSPLKQNDPWRVSGDTIFIFEGEKLFFKCKKQCKKITRITEVKPTTDSINLIIVDFSVFNSSIDEYSPSLVTLFNPYKKTLYYTTYVKYHAEASHHREACLPAQPNNSSRLIWSKRVACVKIFNLHFK